MENDRPLYKIYASTHRRAFNSLYIYIFLYKSNKTKTFIYRASQNQRVKLSAPSCCSEQDARKPEIKPPVGLLQSLQIPPEPHHSLSSDRRETITVGTVRASESVWEKAFLNICDKYIPGGEELLLCCCLDGDRESGRLKKKCVCVCVCSSDKLRHFVYLVGVRQNKHFG